MGTGSFLAANYAGVNTATGSVTFPAAFPSTPSIVIAHTSLSLSFSLPAHLYIFLLSVQTTPAVSSTGFSLSSQVGDSTAAAGTGFASYGWIAFVSNTYRSSTNLQYTLPNSATRTTATNTFTVGAAGSNPQNNDAVLYLVGINMPNNRSAVGISPTINSVTDNSMVVKIHYRSESAGAVVTFSALLYSYRTAEDIPIYTMLLTRINLVPVNNYAYGPEVGILGGTAFIMVGMLGI
jgi:hypothetical protein